MWHVYGLKFQVPIKLKSVIEGFYKIKNPENSRDYW
jgi:hypothetical protein